MSRPGHNVEPHDYDALLTRAGEAFASRIATETTTTGSPNGYPRANLEFRETHPTRIHAVIDNFRTADTECDIDSYTDELVTLCHLATAREPSWPPHCPWPSCHCSASPCS